MGHAAILWGNVAMVCPAGMHTELYTYQSDIGLAQDCLRSPMIPEVLQISTKGSSITLTHLPKQHFATASIFRQLHLSLSVIGLKDWCQ